MADKKVLTVVEKLKKLDEKTKKIAELKRNIIKKDKEKEIKKNAEIDHEYGNLIRSYYAKKWEGMTLEKVQKDLLEILKKSEKKPDTTKQEVKA